MVRPSLLKKLQDRADSEHRTLSNMIELLLEDGVDQKIRQNGLSRKSAWNRPELARNQVTDTSWPQCFHRCD
jgi:hypothetical protein